MRFEGLGADTERALVEVLLSPDAVLAQQVVLALEECWPPGEAATADRAMQAIVELARRTPPGSAPAPGAAGRSRGLTPHEELQLTAIRALGAIGAGSSDARNALTGLATSSEDPVAGTAALLALARWEGEPALLALCSQLLEKDAGNEELPEDVEVGQVLALLELSRLGASAAALLPQVEAVERTRGVCETLNRVVSWEAWNAWLALAPGAPEATLPRLRSMAAELEASRQAGGPQLGSDSTWQYEGARRVLEEIEGR
jgi:hypothetical protein